MQQKYIHFFHFVIQQKPIALKSFLFTAFLLLIISLFNPSAFPIIQAGNQLLYFDISQKGEYFADGASVKTFSSSEINAINFAANYWQVLLGTSPANTKPAAISIGGIDNSFGAGQSMNAYANTYYGTHSNGLTSLANVIINNDFRDSMTTNYFYREKVYAVIGIGKDFAENSDTSKPQILPQGQKIGLSAIVIHELAHALGIFTNAGGANNNYKFKSAGNTGILCNYDKYLFDSWGTPAAIGNNIIQSPASAPANSNFFMIIRYGDSALDDTDASGYAFFKGPKTMEVLGGNFLHKKNNPNLIGGLPILGSEGVNYAPDLSHIELRNSLMSHQEWRNWSILMEAEIALLEDVGFSIDRKNFYGFSLYSDENDIQISSNFYARNSQGNQYLNGVFNETPWTIGLHIYGSSNTVEIKSEVLSKGFNSMGIRIDGWNNKISISSESRISADGEMGNALLVSYGKNHKIVHRGILTADGSDGIAVRFDFGHNIFGDNPALLGGMRGSYIDDWAVVKDEIKGALIESLDISGKVRGNSAAIFISENAYIENINILRGAQIEGGIFSKWDNNNPLIQHHNPQTLVTNLNFGFQTDAQGAAINAADPYFNFTYQNNIYGKTFNVFLRGGAFTFSGAMDLLSFTAESGAVFNVIARRLNPVLIEAESISFSSNNITAFITERFFQYYNKDGYEVLSLRANSISGIDADNVSVVPSGKISIGFYDYQNAIVSKTMQSNSIGFALASYQSRDLSFERLGGEAKSLSAISAPLLSVLQNPIGAAVFDFSVFYLDNDNAGKTSLIVAAPNILSSDIKTSDFHFRIFAAPNYIFTKGKNYSIETLSLPISAAKEIKKNLALGISVKFDAPKYKSDILNADMMSGSAAIFAALKNPLLDAAFFIGAGAASYSQKRLSFDNAEYEASYTGSYYEAGLQISKSFQADKKIKIMPFAAFEFIHSQIEPFGEKGDALPLHYEEQSLNTMQIKAGARSSFSLSKKLTLLDGIYCNFLTGNLGGKSGVFFKDDLERQESIAAEGIKADGISLAAFLGLSYKINNLIQVSAKADLSAGKTQERYGASVLLSFSF
ncbi:MAG: autotransporter outer membrane beta-barrel domain-containing protein [Elusimicrobiota bacterium]|jgi:hypothetical protein|nr:autotransporter outer membrane beta-barrel domain-containing protein [Elusimicrobiota bacterium]